MKAMVYGRNVLCFFQIFPVSDLILQHYEKLDDLKLVYSFVITNTTGNEFEAVAVVQFLCFPHQNVLANHEKA